ncbi:MAG: class I SAM-dependent methyltransferase, partial [Starkeya sp.]|nr:class I SAM-dependent methyltransferase [Starkeya sp.]
YFALCLADPAYGYYRTRDPFGEAGDFITAPEVSQLFGEMLGVFLVHAWQRHGAPETVRIAEIGPGRGTMMADMLRATARVPGLHEAARVVLVEASPRLRARQAETLRGHDVEWVERIEALPPGPLIALGNEFIDALPIRQFVRTPDGIAERMVGLDSAGTLAFGLRPGARLDARGEARLAAAPLGAVLETCPLGLSIAATLGARIAASGGAALLVDYGHAGERERGGGFGDTLQALHRRAFDDVLAHPGEADLTAHVDFAALALAARTAGARVFGPIGQGLLLERLGLDERAFRLKRAASEADREMVEAARLRLAGTEEGQMGALFKALALVHPALDMVAGFAPSELFEDIPA